MARLANTRAAGNATSQPRGKGVWRIADLWGCAIGDQRFRTRSAPRRGLPMRLRRALCTALALLSCAACAGGDKGADEAAVRLFAAAAESSRAQPEGCACAGQSLPVQRRRRTHVQLGGAGACLMRRKTTNSPAQRLLSAFRSGHVASLAPEPRAGRRCAPHATGSTIATSQTRSRCTAPSSAWAYRTPTSS